MNRVKKVWTQEQIQNYYLGIKYSDYPSIFWNKIKKQIAGSSTLIDIGCGPGAFTIKAAEYGLNVQAVDVNEKHLQVLKYYTEKFNLSGIKLIHGEWPDVEVKKCDVSICGYSLGGKIGTVSGIKKVLNITNKLAFFIIPYSKIQTDFSSKELYKNFEIAPPEFKGCYIDTLEIFKQLNEIITFEIVENDFGMPIKSIDNIPFYSEYLCEKLGIHDIDAIQKHLKKIVTMKNGKLWIPNHRKSVMITWKKE